MLKRHWWLLATTAIFAAGAANAQTPAPDLDKVDRMQRQMEQLQEQMKQVKSDLVEAKKKAAEAKAEIPPAFNGAYGADLSRFPPRRRASSTSVKLTWGGFLAAETVYRTPQRGRGHGHAFHCHSLSILAPVRRKRISRQRPAKPALASGRRRSGSGAKALRILRDGLPRRRRDVELQPEQQLGAAHAPRLYFTYDNTEWGFHFLAGQAWSLLTQNKVGITPRQENIPLTIDANYVVGFDYTRNWQLRVVKDFGSWASFGLSIENPAELVYAGTGAVANGGNVGGWLVNFSNAGNTFLGSGGIRQQLHHRCCPRHHRQGRVRSGLGPL